MPDIALAPVGPTLRVLRVIARLNVGGPARHAVLLDEGLRACGFDPLLVHGSVEPHEGSFEHMVAERQLQAVKIPELGRRVSPWSDLQAFRRLLRLTWRYRPDIVHTHTAKGGALGRLAALVYNAGRPRRQRCAVIHTFHGHVLSGYFGPLATTAVRLAERNLARIADRIVTVSASQKDELCRRYRVAPCAKTTVVELGLEIDALQRLDGTPSLLRTTLGFGAGDVVFGYVGRFVPIKDLPSLIAAFGIVASRYPQAALILAGDGEVRVQLEALVSDMGLNGRVRFTGWMHDLTDLYRAIDVAALSSLNEGTPVALIEAMAAGKPAVATDVGGVRDVVGTCGLIVPPRNAARLAGAMAQLIEDDDLRARLGRAARAATASRFAPARLVTEMATLYRDVLAAKRGREEIA